MSDKTYFQKRKFEEFELKRIALMTEIAKTVSQQKQKDLLLGKASLLLDAFEGKNKEALLT